MDNKNYLNQISADIRPNQKSKASFLKSKYFMLGVGAIIAFLIIVIIGNILSGSKASVKDQSISLKLHLDNTIEVISTYQPSIKSSDLRSSSASLSSVLSNTSRELTNYLTEAYQYKNGSASESQVNSADLARDGLESELFEAKINGILDRIYAHKMAYEISIISAEEVNIYNSTSNETLKAIIENSNTSLVNLFDKFENYSESR